MAEGWLARAGLWCYRHRWTVVAIWLVAVAAGALSAGPVFDRLVTSNGPKSLESVQASNVLSATSNQGGTVDAVVQDVAPGTAGVRSAVLAAAADVARISGVTKVATPYDQGVPAQRAAAALARDGRGLRIHVTLANLDRAARNTAVDAAADRLHALRPALVAAGQPGARVLVGGGSVLNRQANQQVRRDLSRAESLSLPITLVVLVFVFGGLVAAGLPVLAAGISVASAMTVLFGFSYLTDLDSNAVTVVTLLGLGLSVDYGLLLVARYREELAAGAEPEVAVGRTWATAGRTIMFSALTVAAALTGLFMFRVPGLSAMSAAGIAIAVMAMLVSLTLTAGLLRLARRRIRPSRRAAARAARYGEAEVGFFARLARGVQRRPAVVAVLTGAALLLAGAPVMSTVLHLPRLDSLPRSMEAVQVAHVLTDEYGVAPAPAMTVVARTDAATLDAWAARWQGRPQVTRVEPAQQVGPNLSTVSVDVAGDSQGGDARALVEAARADRPAGVESWVTGDAAVLTDLLGLIGAGLPWAVAVTLLAMAVLLFAMTGSLVIPVKAVVMNVVSLGATFGVLDAVFERGFLAGPLGLLKVTGIDPFVLVIVFAFAFGLSMDYEVFLLGRIKEYVDQGVQTDRAVRRGLQHSGRVITSAALLMVIVFGCFALARTGTIQQIGLGLAVAVAIDATIVRCLLVPATMTLLGRWNWWAPGPLKRLHARFAPPARHDESRREVDLLPARR
jgi:RND superfamily putative drug exporter